MEKELENARKLESLGILAGGFAHDYNNLLAGIMGNLSLAKLTVRPDEEAYQFLAEMQKSTLQTRDLTRKIITFAKGGEPIKKVVPILPLVNQAVRHALGGSDVNCEVYAPVDLWPVEIDEYQIGQVINSVIHNAMEAISARKQADAETAQPRSIMVNVENTRVDAENSLLLKEGNYIKLSVHDNGVRISEEQLEQIFDPYFSTKERGTQKGMGLGLAICHSIIKRHHGNISVESQVGAGTTFSFYLLHLIKK